MLDYSKFSELLSGRTVSEVCAAADVDPSTISNWKSGNYEPKLPTLVKLARFFGVSVEYFFKEDQG